MEQKLKKEVYTINNHTFIDDELKEKLSKEGFYHSDLEKFIQSGREASDTIRKINKLQKMNSITFFFKSNGITKSELREWLDLDETI